MDNKTFRENMTLTDNGALTPDSTKSSVLDFYSKGGALRGALSSTQTWRAVERLFLSAMEENSLLTTRSLFFLRDVRGGSGERDTFRRLLNLMARTRPDIVGKNLEHIPNFGRWDDLFCLVGTSLESAVFNFIKKQLNVDLNSKTGVSLLGKWMPSINTSSKDSRELANKLRVFLGYSPKEYRKTLAGLRERIRIVERNMCANQWGTINYEEVPSRASMIYRKAFYKHDQARYTEFLDQVESGEKEIKASTLYPYDIVKAIRYSDDAGAKTLEAQWKALPDFLKNNPHNGLCICDVSGSMSGLPMDVAVSLGIYFAERNNGAFKDCFITFSANPELVRIEGNSLKERVRNVECSKWGMNTNLQAVFDLILKAAVANKVPQFQMPNTLYIISDMQFDACTDNKKTNFEAIQEKYKKADYEMPKLVFWNVNANPGKGSPVTRDERGTFLISGCSPAVLKFLFDGVAYTPYELMIETLSGERYKIIEV